MGTHEISFKPNSWYYKHEISDFTSIIFIYVTRVSKENNIDFDVANGVSSNEMIYGLWTLDYYNSNYMTIIYKYKFML